MIMNTLLWLRAETKVGEHRAPLIPSDAAQLVEDGLEVRVEESEQRAFSDSAYAAAGCRLEAAGSWIDAPQDAFVLGLKELPEATTPLRHRHIYFGHVYKGQTGSKELLERFVDGGGTLLDLEYLTDESGTRVAAFGFWAGFAGAALGVRLWAGRKREGVSFQMSPQRPATDQQELIVAINSRLGLIPEGERREPRAIVVGARGRCGRGAVALFDALGMEVDQWDLEETSAGGPFAELLDYDLMVNAVLLRDPIAPFLTHEELHRDGRRLSVISDVSCDPGNPGNPLPIYDRITTFKEPSLRIVEGDNPLDLIAIDHLPSLLPRESSIDFSSQLLPYLRALPHQDPAWQRCVEQFHQHVTNS
jgi:saccharopine dehydrogenase (NAD+, L-lysine forming)